MLFKDLCLSPVLQSTLENLGYVEPTEIQQKVISLIFQGQDVMGIAQTGTGKTAAYALPLIDLLQHGRKRGKMASCLVLVPTRELAEQVAQSFAEYGKDFGLKTATLIGGVAQSKQLAALSKGPDVLIATPGRFLDFYQRGKILLAGINYFIIDEADRMLDMGFIPDIEHINSLLPKNRQALLFSATMAPGVQKCADKLLDAPKIVKVTPKTVLSDRVVQHFICLPKFKPKESYKKRQIMRDVIAQHNITQAIIFCNKKLDVDYLEKSMKRHGFKVAALHGDIHQSKRSDVLTQFKNGDFDILIASDVAARGIDVEGLPFVINFDFPVNNEDYVHRIGRTGRAGQSGQAWTFLEAAEWKKASRIIPKEPVFEEGFDPSVWDEKARSKEAPSKHKKEKKASDAGKEEKEPSRKPTAQKERKAKTEEPQKPVVGFGEDVPAFLRQSF